MRKTTALVSTVLLLSTAFSGCAAKGNDSQKNENNDNVTTAATASDMADAADTADSSQETSETTAHIMGKVNNAYSPDPIEVDFVASDHGLILPFTDSIAEDYTAEDTTATVGFIDKDGNIVCEGIFDKVSSFDEAKVYIVRCTVDGVSKYGFISYDGSIFTGMVYDGASINEGDDSNLSFFGTKYVDGKLEVTGLDNNLKETSREEIALNEDELGLDASTSLLSVSFLENNRAILMNLDSFYYSKFLIDTTDGSLLYSTNTFGYEYGKLFGHVIVEQDVRGENVKVFNLDGQEILNANAYSWKVCNDRYMVAADGKLALYNGDWKEVDSMDIAEDAIVMSSFGQIAVYQDECTKVYNKELELVAEPENVDLRMGNFQRDWYNFGEGDMYFQIYGDDEYEYINLNTGARKTYEKEFNSGITFEFFNGYIIAQKDYGDGWSAYDGNFNLIYEADGQSYSFVDPATGKTYVSYTDAGTTNVYSLDDEEVVLTCDQELSGFRAYDGILIGTGRYYGLAEDEQIAFDSEGNEIFRRPLKVSNKGIEIDSDLFG